MEKQKRIVFFGVKYFPSKGGTSRVVENIIRNLAGTYDITIYCYKDPLAKGFIKGVKTVEIPEIRLGNFGVFLFYLCCYWHVKFKGDVDLIHAHKIDSFFFLNGLAKKTKVIATAHEAPYKRDKWGKLAKLFFKANERKFLRFNGTRTAISKPLCEFYQKTYGVDVHFIANGINLHEKKSESRVAEFWPEGLPRDTPFVLFSARRIMGTKGLHTLLMALNKIQYTGTVLIAGELDNYPAYMERIYKLAEGLQVHFLGFVNPLPALLQLVEKCDFFIFPSEIEGMSIMLLEVASTGKPIIASDIPENTQVFDPNEVLYFKNKQVDDLVEKLIWAQNNPAAFDEFGLRAKEKVASKYTWQRISLDYRSLYEKVLNDK